MYINKQKKSIKLLKNNGIKCLLFDLDNTLVPISDKKPSEKLKKFIDNLKANGLIQNSEDLDKCLLL